MNASNLILGEKVANFLLSLTASNEEQYSDLKRPYGDGKIE